MKKTHTARVEKDGVTLRIPKISLIDFTTNGWIEKKVIEPVIHPSLKKNWKK